MKKNVLIINRIGYKNYCDDEKKSFFPKDKFNVFLITNKKRYQEFPEDFFCKLFIFEKEDGIDIKTIAEKINLSDKIHYIISLSEKFMEIAGELRDKFEIPGITFGDSLKFRNKVLMKNILRKKEIRIPDFSSEVNLEIIKKFLKNYNKVVIKEKNGMGSQNTFIIDNYKMAKKVYNDIFTKIDNYEIEEFINGTMYHIDSIVDNENVLFSSISKYLGSTLNFLDKKPLISVMEDDDMIIKKMNIFNEKVIKAFQLKKGVTHHEVFLTSENEVVFCEIAARTGGAGVVPAIKNSYNINLHKEFINSLLNKNLEIYPSFKKVYSGWIEIYGSEGKIKKISNEKEFELPWIIQKKIIKKKSEIIKKAEFSTDSIASFVFEDSSTNGLIEKADIICKMFEVIYE